MTNDGFGALPDGLFLLKKGMKTFITIQNLKCGGCGATIERAIRKFPEVADVSINIEKSLVDIETELPADLPKFRAALRHAGYPPEGEENLFGDKAKSFVSCAIGRVTK